MIRDSYWRDKALELWDKYVQLGPGPEEYEDWQLYRQELTDFIAEACRQAGQACGAVAGGQERQACGAVAGSDGPDIDLAIFGAGACLDIDLARLRPLCRRLVLIDRDGAALARAAKKAQVTIKEENLSYIRSETYVDYIYLALRSFGNAGSEAEAEAAARELIRFVYDTYEETGGVKRVYNDGQYDLVVAAGLHSQLNNVFTALLTYIIEALAGAGYPYIGTVQEAAKAIEEVQYRYTAAMMQDLNERLVAALKPGGQLLVGLEKGLATGEYGVAAEAGGREAAAEADRRETAGTGRRIAGAYEAANDLGQRVAEGRLSIRAAKNLIWPLDKRRGIAYEMAVLSMSLETSFKNDLAKHGLEIPYSTDTTQLVKPLTLYGKKLANRLGILPLEGFDSALDGSPTDSVYRRYLRFVAGGAGLIWFEACAVSEDGKSNLYQMMLQDGNLEAFKRLLGAMDRKAAELGRTPALKILQLTHSGRVSKNENWEPIPLSPKSYGDQDQARAASDEQIKKMVEDHIYAAELAAEAGFDVVDIKVCHGYFLSELLSAFDRPGSYGGSFENRTRAIFEIIDGITERLGNRIGISVRLNAYDSEPAPYGYGIEVEDGRKRANLTEAIRLCQSLRGRGVELVNISASAPRDHLFGSEVTDAKYSGYVTSCDYLMAVRILKDRVPGLHFMCTGLTSFGPEGGYVAAGGIAEGWFDIAGFGRQALAYPDFAGDLLAEGALKKDACCVNCYKCYSMMDPGHCRTGCIVRDREEFYPVYSKYVLGRD